MRLGAFNQEKALVRAFSVIVKASRTFVWSSTAQATYSHAGQRRIISKPASFNEVARVSESRLCRRGHTSRAQHHRVHSFI